MLWLFISLGQGLLDAGYSAALIRKLDADRLDESSVFYLNIALGLLSAGLLSLSAGWIAGFYRAPVLVSVTCWMSLNLVINAFGVVQTAVLTKNLDFKSQMKAGVTATLISGSLAIALAYRGFGVYSLVVQALALNFIRTVLLWAFSAWRPRLAFSAASLRGMFGFSSNMLAFSLINTVFYNMHIVVIGRLFSAADLGYYSRAQTIQQVPVQNILSNTITRVIYPIFSTMQEDLERLKKSLGQALTATALVNFPLMAGTAAIAGRMIDVLLTAKWAPAAPYLQLLCAVGALYPLQQINLNALQAQGRSGLYLKIESISKTLALIAIVITYRWGITAMIYGQIAVAGFAYYLSCSYSGKLLRYPFLEQMRDLAPSLFISLAMGGVVYLAGRIPIAHQALLLLLQVISGMAFYGLLCYIFKLPAYEAIVQTIKPKLTSYFSL